MKEVMLKTEEILFDGNITSYKNEARLIVSHILNVGVSELLLKDISVDEETREKCYSMARKRCEKYPLQYLLGAWDFYGRDFLVGEGVLIPRFDTEVLVEKAVNYINESSTENPLKVLDLCAGTGCISITIEKEAKNIDVTAVEKYDEAYSYLLKNIDLHKSNVKPIKADIFDYYNEIEDNSIDCIVSNPPYISDSEIKFLSPEVFHEPKTALYATENGVYFYKRIAQLYYDKLKTGGMLAFEVGFNQQRLVNSIFSENNYKNICQIPDLCGIIRVVTATK